MAYASEVSFDERVAAPLRGGIQSTLVPRWLNHLKALEAESIHILREAAAEFARPAMLYSIGKDSTARGSQRRKQNRERTIE